ncbi:MAG: hypothetical protein M3O31_07135 [Acidobacteriota bacterium]|nr:hypothetical protein [Acidobacteriota bacterium]
MPISFRRSPLAGTSPLLPALLMCLFSFPAAQAIAQDTPPPLTPVQKQLEKIDFAISAAGSFGSTVSGIEKRDANTTHTLLTIRPSSSVGELFALRYTVKPYVGFELNVSNLRFSQDYKFVPPPATNLLYGGAQSAVREMTLGYVAHLKYRPFGVTPYLGAGGGTIRFKPTAGGGQGLPQQYRALYYYTAGVEGNFPDSHFGMRVGFRQLFYLAPDFLQNYLTITRRTISSEPTIGFFVRF